MTNHWIDLKNADVILVMGANPAANHPISMKWVTRAQERGAKLVGRARPLGDVLGVVDLIEENLFVRIDIHAHHKEVF